MAFINNPKYENVPSDEESEASLRLRSVSRATISRATILRDSVFTLLGLAIGLSVAFSINYKEAAQKPESGQCWVFGNATPIPSDVIERVPQVFQPDPRYFGNSEQIDLNWKTLVDSDAIWVGNPEEYGLGQGMQPPKQYPLPYTNTSALPSNFYDVSTLHQVHCLSKIRTRYWQLMTVGYQADDPNNEEMESHVEHCIEYLRLSLACGDFLIVEPNDSGWGLERQCINYPKLRAFQDSQAALYIDSWADSGSAPI